MAKKQSRSEALWATADDVEAVLHLFQVAAEQAEESVDDELRELLERNAAIEDPVARVAGYPRISEYRPERARFQGGDIGVVRQAKNILVHATGRNIRIVAWYVDNDFTASNPRRPRPGYTLMFSHLKAGHHGGVIAWDLLRLYRQYLEFQALVEHVEDHPEVYVTTVEGDVNLTTESGVLMAGFMVLIGAMESALISKRIKDKEASRAKAGHWHGGHLPFGYRRAVVKIKTSEVIVPGKIEPDPKEAATVRRAVQLVLAGTSLNRIPGILANEGHYGRSGGHLSPSTLRGFLLSPTLEGIRVHQPRSRRTGQKQGAENRYAAEWEPIISSADAAVLRALLMDPKRRTNGNNTGNIRTYELAGLLTCGREGCGTTMIGRNWTDYVTKEKHRRYQCPKCTVSRMAVRVEARILELMREWPERERLVAAQTVDVEDPDRARLSEELTAVRSELDVAEQTLKESGVSLARWAPAIAALETRAQELTTRLRPKPPPYAPMTDQLLAWDKLTPGERHNIVKDFLDGAKLDVVIMPMGRGWGSRAGNLAMEIRPRPEPPEEGSPEDDAPE